jgi:hypothetical protein
MKDNKGLRLLTYVTGLVIGNSASVGVAQVSCALAARFKVAHYRSFRLTPIRNCLMA